MLSVCEHESQGHVLPILVCSQNPSGLKKIAKDSHNLLRVNMEGQDDRNPKLKIFISELILD
jgi:hypothetical protein